MTDPVPNDSFEPNGQPDEAPEPEAGAPSEAMSLTAIWRRNGKPMLLVIGLTVAALTVYTFVTGLDGQQTAGRMLVAQLWIMTGLMPPAAHFATRPIDALYRSGVTNDSFGVYMVVLGLATGQWSFLAAVKLYVLISAVGLLLIGLFVAVRSLNLAALLPALGMVGLGLVIAAAHTFIPASALEGLPDLGRLNLLSAVADVLGTQLADVSWMVTFLIYGAAAGLCWSVPLIVGPVASTEEEQ